MLIQRTRIWLIAAAFTLALMVAATWLLHENYTTRVPGANDFFSRWAGAHLYFTRGWNPYSDETSLWIQEQIYGQAASPEQDASLFAYPLYTIFLIVPYAFMPYDWAQAAWQVTLLAVVVATVFLLLNYFRWKPKPAVLGMIMLWSLFFYPTARSLILGQLGLVVFMLTVAAMLLLFRSQQASPSADVWAGILLAITTIKPQMQFLIVPFLMLWALRVKRWRMIISFAVTSLALLLISFALIPTWLTQWIAQVQQYPEYTPPAVIYILTHEVLPLGGAALIVERVLEIGLIVYLLWEWWRVLAASATERQLDWVMGLTLVITHLVAPRTATTHFVVFTFLLFPIIRDLSRRNLVSAFVVVSTLLILLVGMWWLFLATITGNQEANIVHVPLPLLMIVLALFNRPSQAESVK